MANYASLKAAIQEVVKTNGNNEITGALLQQALLAMINALGVGYQFMDLATPSTNPGTPDQNVFYIASTFGNYANFGNLVVNKNEVAILAYNGTWTKKVWGAATQEQVDELTQRVENLEDNQINMYGEILPTQQYDGKTVNAQGEVVASSYSTSVVKEFPIDLVNNDYLGTYGFGGSQTATWTLNYYDEDFNYLGGACINPGGLPATMTTMGKLLYPDSWQGNIEYYKQRTKFIRMVGLGTGRPVYLYETWTVPQSILSRDVTPNELNIFIAIIRTPMAKKTTISNTEIVTQPTPSPWGIIFPQTYSRVGTPTPIIAMLHGANGYVSEGCLGYNSAGWVAQRELYLQAGFAVMDINGYGVSASSDQYSKHWGCPLAVETLDKAFEFLKRNYNVCGKLLIAGTSMGGILAMSYTKSHPGNVAAVACFAPNNFAYSCRFIPDSSKFLAWGYESQEEAEEHEFNELSGYVPLNECQIADENTGVLSQFEWSEYTADDREIIQNLRLIDRFPVQIRIWQGSIDDQVPYMDSVLLYNSFIRSNSPASIRICNGAGHSLESVAYVRREAVDYFKRFVVLQP